MEKTTVKDFIDKYLISSKEVQNEMMDKIVLRKYMPYEAKVVLSKKIIASHRLDKEGYVNSDTCSMHLSLIASILQYYTYFEIKADEAAYAYDLLQEHGLLDVIIEKKIGRDIVELRNVFAMCQGDFDTNHISIFAFANKCFKKVLDVLTTTFHDLEKKIESDD